MRVALFDFDLPAAQIAHAPVHPRDAAKLLYVPAHNVNDSVPIEGAFNDLHVFDLPKLLSPGDVLVLNDSRVIPARLFTQIGEKKIELLLHQPVGQGTITQWLAFAKPAKKLKLGMRLTFASEFEAIVIDRTEDGQVILEFPYDSKLLFEKLHVHGHVPLPPYIARADEETDKENYQTIYAKQDGSVAAPTAGLHFTPQLMEALQARGIQIAYVTLHVGAGTFQPVKVEDTEAHVMHREAIEINAEAAARINEARQKGGKVVAVGTTSLRILESVAAEDGTLSAFSGSTAIFITPGYRFKIVDRLMTNFHLPKSTLFMLVSAFAGRERMLAAYQHAIAHGYRFYSYGDTSLLERAV